MYRNEVEIEWVRERGTYQPGREELPEDYEETMRQVESELMDEAIREAEYLDAIAEADAGQYDEIPW